MTVNPFLLDEARLALRRVVEEDADTERYLNAAEAAVFKYLNWEVEDYEAASEGVRTLVDNSIIILAGHYSRSPDVDDADAFGQGKLPYMVTAGIYQLRDPALA